MKKYLLQLMMLAFSVTTTPSSFAAADSYRFLHVTIDTPWAIFLIILTLIMIPFILMAVLYWYFAFKKNKDQVDVESVQSAEKTPE